MPITIDIEINQERVTFELDFNKLRWVAASVLPEGYFPLTTELNERRYELYSDGTFAEVELGHGSKAQER